MAHDNIALIRPFPRFTVKSIFGLLGRSVVITNRDEFEDAKQNKREKIE